MDIEKKVRELIESDLNEHDYLIDNIEYVKEGTSYFLRVVIDKEGVIDIEDCVTVSKLINPILDENDFIKDNYVLDVCSKGGIDYE